MTYEEFYEMPVLSTLFPLKFGYNQVEWTELTLFCNDCKKKVDSNSTRGTVTKVFSSGYRTVKVDYELYIYGLCTECDVMTRAVYTLHDDLTLSGVDPKTGKINRWKLNSQKNWWNKLFMTLFSW